MELEEDIGNSSKLSDITLSERKTGDNAVPNEEKLSSKTNSLKRFFKMPTKRVIDSLPNTAEVDGPSADTPEVVEAGEGVADEGAAGPEDKEPPRRFHLRLGPVRKHQSLFTRDDIGNANVASGSTPKPGLKGSISNYWNLIFKRSKMIGKNEKSETKKTESEEDDEEEITEREIQEEVHQLAISEEPEETNNS